MAEKRKVDVLAKNDNSIAGRLRRNRMAIEDGDPSGGRSDQPEPKPDPNEANEVIRRGFFKEKG